MKNKIDEKQIKGKENIKSFSFYLSEEQFRKLKILKNHGYCKIMYIIRLAAYHIANMQVQKIKSYKDLNFSIKNGKHYKVDLPLEVYFKLESKKKETGLSRSKLIRIGLCDVLNLIEF